MFKELHLLTKDNKPLDRFAKKKCEDLKFHIANVLDYFIINRARARHEIVYRGNNKIDNI
jgi:hypothetical protein